jgi:hypothetical protein
MCGEEMLKRKKTIKSNARSCRSYRQEQPDEYAELCLSKYRLAVPVERLAVAAMTLATGFAGADLLR